VLALLMAGSPVAGDWLVTREGARVETKGPWRVKGKLVVFTEKGGRLSSMRLAEVDLAASGQATRDAEAEASKPPEPAPEPPKKKSVRVVTDADVAHVDQPTGDAKDDKAAAGTEQVEGNSVVVSTWKQYDLPGKEGIGISGELRNQGRELATNVRVTVMLYNEVKEVLGSDDAILGVPAGNGSAATQGNTALRPGSTVQFHTEFPGVFSFVKADFNVTSLSLKVKAAEPKPPGEAGEAPPPP
jgi:hypothetical protein